MEGGGIVSPELDAATLWFHYGTYCDKCAVADEVPMTFAEWETEARRLAGDQLDLLEVTP